MMSDKEFEKYEIDRVVARWILEGQKGIETKKVQDWLIENGYENLIPKGLNHEK